MRIVSVKSYRENKNIISYSIILFFENRFFYEIMWKNTVAPDRPQMAIWLMRIACWIPKATDTLAKM
jgi:hypothetical protein